VAILRRPNHTRYFRRWDEGTCCILSNFCEPPPPGISWFPASFPSNFLSLTSLRYESSVNTCTLPVPLASFAGRTPLVGSLSAGLCAFWLAMGYRRWRAMSVSSGKAGVYSLSSQSWWLLEPLRATVTWRVIGDWRNSARRGWRSRPDFARTAFQSPRIAERLDPVQYLPSIRD
jgi:hypothetical protein